MALKIGIVSPNLSNLPKTTNDSVFFWFKEIEAAWAYLLNNRLDELHIDPELIKKPVSQKYQDMIAKLHQDLAIKIFVPEITLSGNIECFPLLEEIFKDARIESFFQPIVDGSEDKPSIYGLECLTRFIYQGKKLSPEFLFNYAQEQFKIAELDRCCIELALNQVPHDNGLIFINVRPETLVSLDFPTWLFESLKKSKLDKDKIVLEITEQHCHILEEAIRHHSEELTSLGIKLAIDDFGTGLANLSMLETIKPSYLKISGRFSKNIHKDRSKQLMIKNILELATSFEIKAVIECVESKEEWLELKKLGALLAQGFYFYKPMSKEDIAKLA